MSLVDILLFLIAFFPLLSTPKGHTLRCQSWPPPRFLSSFPSQHAGDCVFLLSHIPGTLFHQLAPTPASLSPPFLPRTYISHKTCSLQITWRFSEVTSIVTTNPWQPSPPVMEAFSYVAPVGRDLVRECIWSGWGEVALKAIRGIKLNIYLGGPGAHWAWRMR